MLLSHRKSMLGYVPSWSLDIIERSRIDAPTSAGRKGEGARDRAPRHAHRHLWVKDNGSVWNENELTKILRAECARAEVPSLSMSYWRQISASIIKMKFGPDAKCFLGEDEEGDGVTQDNNLLENDD